MRDARPEKAPASSPDHTKFTTISRGNPARNCNHRLEILVEQTLPDCLTHHCVNNGLRDGKNEQRIKRRHEVVEHDAEAVLERALVIADGGRLENIEHAKEQKRRRLPQRRRRDEEQYEQECDYFVPYHATMIGHTERAAGPLARPHAESEQCGQHNQKFHCRQTRCNQPIKRQREERARGPRSIRREPNPSAERDEMRGMPEQKTPGWSYSKADALHQDNALGANGALQPPT